MTRQKSFKRRVRARMDKTGERYTAARRQLLAKAEAATIDPGSPPKAAPDPAAQAATKEPGAAPDVPGAKRPYSDAVIQALRDHLQKSESELK